MHPQVLEFDYTLLNHRWMPMIPVALSYRSQTVKVEAYVDSGAFYSIFNIEVAQDLRIHFSDAKKTKFVVGDGKEITAWILKLPINIGPQSFVADIALSEELRVGFNLLGRKGIFDHFDEVAFQEKRRKILFRL